MKKEAEPRRLCVNMTKIETRKILRVVHSGLLKNHRVLYRSLNPYRYFQY